MSECSNECKNIKCDGEGCSSGICASKPNPKVSSEAKKNTQCQDFIEKTQLSSTVSKIGD